MPQSSVAALRAAENDYPLQREVGRITRELNPTSVLTRRRHDLWQRGIVDHFSTAYKAPDGHVKFRSLADIAAARDAARGGNGGGRRSGARGGGGCRSTEKPSSGQGQTVPALVSDDDHDDDSPEEETFNAQQLRLRDQQTRRVGRVARSQLYKSLVQSERRLKLCKNGVTDPYSAEHVALWDGSAQRRNLSALADTSGSRRRQRLQQQQAEGIEATLSIEARAATSQTPVPRASSAVTTLGSKLPPIGRPGARSAPLPIQDDDFASPLINPVDPDETDFGVAAVADTNDAEVIDAHPVSVMSKVQAEAPPEEVSSFFFTQPSFRIAMDESARDILLAERREEEEEHQRAERERSNSQATHGSTRRLTRGASMIAQAAGPRGAVPPLGRAVAQQALSPGSAASGATRDQSSTVGQLGLSPGGHSKANASPRTADQLHASAAESLRLRKRFKAVPAQQILSREYRPPSPGDKANAKGGQDDLSSKLRTHPHFQAELYARGDSFHQGARDRFARKQQEQRPKYDKKYRALDVGGAPLPFHATPAAILHHVEAVIQRDERASSRADKYASQLAELQDIAAYLQAHARHPKIATMLEITSGLFGPDRPDPGQEQLFGQTFAALEDSDFLFHDVVDACVHIGAAYGVGEKAVIDHARSRAGRFIHDQPQRLLETMERVDARYTAAPTAAGQSVGFSVPASGTRTGAASPNAHEANRSHTHRSRSVSGFTRD